MSGGWADSNRRSELPRDWEQVRNRIFRRDGGRCTFKYPKGGRCSAPATDCDHLGDKGVHEDWNLTSLCAPHHLMKSSRQGVDARAEKKRSAKRPREVDPRTVA